VNGADHTKDERDRLLLIHFGQMGDAVLALPAARAFAAWGGAERVTVLASRSGAEIFRLAGFRSVWPVDRVRWKARPATAVWEIPRLVWQLRRQRFALSVDLHSLKETNLLAWLAGVPTRVAMLRPTRSYPRLINRPPPPDDPEAALLERYCRVLEPLGITVEDRCPRLSPSAAETAAAAARLPGKDWLGVCPGAGHASRRWPAERFAAVVCAGLQAAPALRAVVFAGPEESEATLAPFRLAPRTQIVRGLSLAALAASLARCRVVLSNASGPAHVAAAVGAHVISIGEIPPFDPVGWTPDAVRVVRAHGRVVDVPQSAVTAALAGMLTAG